MDIITGSSSGVPIYEQIVRQVKDLILSGDLSEGEALPSMRLLARTCAFPSSPPNEPMRNWSGTGF